MAIQAYQAVIKQGAGYQTLELDGVEFPYTTSEIAVQSNENAPDIDFVMVIIPTLSKVQYE